jgi:hypothetical protein
MIWSDPLLLSTRRIQSVLDPVSRKELLSWATRLCFVDVREQESGGRVVDCAGASLPMVIIMEDCDHLMTLFGFFQLVVQKQYSPPH